VVDFEIDELRMCDGALIRSSARHPNLVSCCLVANFALSAQVADEVVCTVNPGIVLKEFFKVKEINRTRIPGSRDHVP